MGEFTRLKWTRQGYKQLLSCLHDMAEEEYRDFACRLTPTSLPLIGVRLPALRRIAKEIARGEFREYLSFAQDNFYEEVMLQGLVIGAIKTDLEEVLSLTEAFVPKIDNWAINDSFTGSLKITAKNPERVFEFLQPYFSKSGEFEVRFGVTMLLGYYVTKEYLLKVLAILDKIRQDGYYVKMAVAWTLSVCFVKFPQQVMPYLKNNHLDDFTYNKTLQKIVESNRVSLETKQSIREMKRK